MRKRRVFTAEFKRETVRQFETGQSATRICQDTILARFLIADFDRSTISKLILFHGVSVCVWGERRA